MTTNRRRTWHQGHLGSLASHTLHPGLAPETTWALTIRRENGSEPDTHAARARSHSNRACPGLRRTFDPQFGMAFGLVCPGRRRHLACRPHRLVDRVEGLGLSHSYATRALPWNQRLGLFLRRSRRYGDASVPGV